MMYYLGIGYLSILVLVMNYYQMILMISDQWYCLGIRYLSLIQTKFLVVTDIQWSDDIDY